MIKFKDLSLPLKFLVVFGWIFLSLELLFYLVAFLTGYVGAFL